MERCEEEMKGLEEKMKDEENRLKKLSLAIEETKKIQQKLEAGYKEGISEEREEQLEQFLISLEESIKKVRFFLAETNIGVEGHFCQGYIYFWKSKLHPRWNNGTEEGILEDYPYLKPTL